MSQTDNADWWAATCSLKDKEMKYRPCPECGSPVLSDATRAKCIKTYICTQCRAQLWLIQSPLFDKLIIAQVGSK